MEYISLKNVRVTDPYFVNVMRVVKEQMLPYQWDSINDRVPGAVKSHCIENFRIAAGEAEGEFGGAVFQDTDVYKWLEAVAYSLIVFPDAHLEALADETIDLIGRAQQADGYLNTYYTIAEPENRWSNLMEGHELYTAGHMFEAAVAYHQATGKDEFLRIASRFADLICSVFGPEPNKCHGYPGHPEIELSLFRLADETGVARYAELARHFLNVRGQGENWFEKEKRRPGHRYIFPEMATFPPEYSQSHRPVRLQRAADGHAVRAMYLGCAMADDALRTGEPAMREACEALYQNVISRRMYITGAIGSAAHGERFTSDYDLPNDTVYGETCASIGLMRLSARMFRLTGDAKCFHIWEKALYNAVLAGMSQDGRRFFYVNPLESDPDSIECDPTRAHVRPERQKWFGVSCCPPNIARTALSIGGNLYAQKDGDLYVLSHIPSEASWDGGRAALTRDGERYALKLSGAPCACFLRLPDGAECSLADSGNGFARIDHAGGEAEYGYTIRPRPRLMMANPRVRADVGKAAVVCGEVVYCLEGVDNGENLGAVYVDADTTFERVDMAFLPEGMHALRMRGWRLSTRGWADALYRPLAAEFTPCELIAIPYSQWNNRGKSEMVVWLHVR